MLLIGFQLIVAKRHNRNIANGDYVPAEFKSL